MAALLAQRFVGVSVGKPCLFWQRGGRYGGGVADLLDKFVVKGGKLRVAFLHDKRSEWQADRDVVDGVGRGDGCGGDGDFDLLRGHDGGFFFPLVGITF